MEGGAGGGGGGSSSSGSGSGSGGGQQREFAEGCKLQITTTFGEAIEGHVLTYDKGMNILVLHILFLRPVLSRADAVSVSSCVRECQGIRVWGSGFRLCFRGMD